MKKASSRASGAARRTKAAWVGRSVSSFRLSDIEALIADEIPYIHIPRYFSTDWCAEIVRRFLAGPTEDHDYGVAKYRTLGMSLVGFIQSRTPMASYFGRAAELMKALRDVYRGGDDPYLNLRREISAGTGWKYFDVQEKGRSYASDIIGAIPPDYGLIPHCDSPWAFPGMAVSGFPCLLSWNIYLSTSDQGGKLLIYRRCPTKEEEAARLKGNDSASGFLGEVEKAEFQPGRGDLILHNPAFYHEVQISKGASQRITAHSWISADPARKVFSFWH